MLPVVLCLAATLLLMMLMERAALPRSNRPFLHRVSLLAAMPPLVFFLTVFMVSYRPVLAMAATLIAFAAVIVANNAKYRALREPLVFSDFALLRQAFRHPALYVKYIGPWKIAAVSVAAAIAVVAAPLLEPPVILRTQPRDYLPSLIYLLVVAGLLYAVTQGPLRRPFARLLWRFGPSTDVRRDIDMLGLVACLIFYFVLANENEPPAEPSAAPPQPAAPVLRWGEPLPDVVAVQSESFFDARRIDPGIDRAILAEYDACCREASYHGHLTVPAWGANTMRTEFAFLSGLPNEALGVHRFNPYLQLCRRPVWTVAHQLRAVGYRTVCVHPFAADFFDRATVYPNLGFDLFLDIDAFEGAETFGPYVSDRAVGEKIAEVLDTHDGPQFVFAITMENHGKWEPGRLGDDGPGPAPLGSEALGLYLRHLANTDRLVADLTRTLKRRPRPGVFCLFGDHLPSLPDAFARAGFDDERSDYVVWRTSGNQPRRLDTSADVLGRLLLDAVFNQANHQRAAATDDPARPLDAGAPA